MKESIRVLRVREGKGSFEEIENSVKSFRKAVCGRYTEYMPFGDEHVLLVNSEELDQRKEITGTIRNEKGEITEILIGDFLIARCGVTDGTYSDMDPDDPADSWLFEQFRCRPVLRYLKGRFIDA